MKKFILVLCSLLLTQHYVLAQCTVVPVSLEKNVRSAETIIEAEVTSVQSYYNTERTLIYTANELKLTAVFKGGIQAATEKCIVITEGGTIGLERLHVSPSLELQVGEKGVFMLKNTTTKLSQFYTDWPIYEGRMSIQSFIKYDMHENSAHAHHKRYPSIEADFLTELVSYCEDEPIYLRNKKSRGIIPLAAPVISSFSSDTTTSGTANLLTINGSNFGATQGSGKVAFRDANFGDGRFYTAKFATTIKSWSDTKIEVNVPTRAGTGKVRVTNNSNESGTSTKEIVISYAHLNVGYGNSSIDSAYFQMKHISTNSKGGYSWRMQTKFSQNQNAVNAFIRSAESWRCKTQMNWDIGIDTSLDQIQRDDVNLVRFTKFTDSKLGVCYSWYSGCFSGGTIYWFVRELDIEFDSSRNWYYGSGSPQNSQFDFQSVATHELGHGHQLGHVIDDTKIMHYSIGAGQRKADLSSSDIKGGIYVKGESENNIPCNSNQYVAIDLDKCNLAKPNASFTHSPNSVCPNTDITFTNESEGNPSAFSWNFGSGATKTTATGAGPHTIQYSTAGEKNVELIVTNSFGTDTINKIVTVLGSTVDQPKAFSFNAEECVGSTIKYEIEDVTDASSYLWTLDNGGSINGSSTQKEVIVRWTDESGPNDLSVVAKTDCGTSLPTTAKITVIPKAEASFTQTADGREVSFTSTSIGATEWDWDFGDGNSSTDENPVHTYADKGKYSVKLTAKNSCSDDDKTEEVSVSYGASIVKTEKGTIRIFPNPASNVINITAEGEEIDEVVLFDELGKRIGTFKSIHSDTKINISHLASGMYTYQIVTKSGQLLNGKIVIQ